jgi:hypothetical protein
MADQLTHDELRDLLGAFALDAVDPDEAVLVEAHLATCAPCRAEVAEHREVAALLASEPSETPTAPWARIAADINGRAPVVPLATAARRLRSVRWAIGAAAAILIVGLGSLGWLAVRQQDRLDRLNRDLAAIDSQQTVTQAAAKAAAMPGARQLQLRGPGGPVASVVLLRDGTGYFLPESGLSNLARGRTYQLWGVAGTEKISLGVLGAEPGVSQLKVPAAVTILAVTDEVDPGVVASTNAPLATASI